jgi:hypothetical protein
MRPFRLIAIVPAEHLVSEWRWDLESLRKRQYDWEIRHWFSSGFDERRAECERAKVCASAGVNAAGYNLNGTAALASLPSI